MKRMFLAALCAASITTPALAVEDPAAGSLDSRMRTIPYNPEQVVHLSTAVGATLSVAFGSDETVTQVAVTDSKDLKAVPARNFLFFKSQSALAPQPVIVLTTNSANAIRRYVFEVTTVDVKKLDSQAQDVYYSVQFTYPTEIAARHRAAALAESKKEAADEAARAAELQLQLAHERMEAESRDPLSIQAVSPKNWRYLAQGNRSILPLEVWDNGFSTVFRFPGNVRVPSIFVINPDGKETTADYSVKGNLVQVSTVARQWRLRDGQTVLCVFNQAFNPVGNNPGTGTASADVQRITKDAPR
jgi:type IV secretion system protein VirB9